MEQINHLPASHLQTLPAPAKEWNRAGMTPSCSLLHPLSRLLVLAGTLPSPWYLAEAPGCGEGALWEAWAGHQVLASVTGVFGAVKECLECASCGHGGHQICTVLPTSWANPEVLPVIVYPCLVSAASTVPQTPNLHASALLGTQGMGPIAQVCPAKTRWNKWQEVARGKITQMLFLSAIHHEHCHALGEMFCSPQLYTGFSWCC